MLRHNENTKFEKHDKCLKDSWKCWHICDNQTCEKKWTNYLIIRIFQNKSTKYTKKSVLKKCFKHEVYLKSNQMWSNMFLVACCGYILKKTV